MTDDLISRQAAIYAVDSETVSTNPEHFKSSQRFIKFMDDTEIASFGKWQWANGFNTALTAITIQLSNLPSAQPVAKDINVPIKDCISRQAAIDELEERLRANGYTNVALVSELNRCIGYIMQLPSAQPEIAENLYLYKCFITDKDGLQHEVIHTGDIRRVTGWEI